MRKYPGTENTPPVFRYRWISGVTASILPVHAVLTLQVDLMGKGFRLHDHQRLLTNGFS